MAIASNELKKIKNQIGEAKDIHEDKVRKPLETYREYYRGNQWNDKLAGHNKPFRHATVENLVFSNISTIKPSINLNNPKIFVRPSKKPYQLEDGTLFNTGAAAQLLEILLNYYWKSLKLKKQVDKALTDALLGHWGLIQVGYTFKAEKVKDGKLLEINSLIREDSPFALRVSPLDLLVDPEATDHNLEDANWIAIRWEKDLEVVKRNPKYTGTGNLKPNLTTDDSDNKQEKSLNLGKGFGDDDKPYRDRVEGYTYYDKVNQKIYDVVLTHDKALSEKDWKLKSNNFSIKTLYFNENPDELLPISDVSIYKPQQDELNRLRSLQLSHVERVSKRAFITSQGNLPAEEKTKLTHGPDGVIIEAQRGPDSVVPLKDGTISQDMWLTIQSLRQGVRENSGIADFERGVAKKFDTATEPALIAQSTTIKRTERTTQLESFIRDVVTELANVIQQTFRGQSIPLDKDDFDRVEQIAPDRLESVTVTPQAANQFGNVPIKKRPVSSNKNIKKILGDDVEVLLPWLNLEKSDIMGDFDFDIEVGSTQPLNQETRKRDILQLKQILEGSPYINAEEATKAVLEAFDRNDIDKLMRTQKEVEQQQMQQAQTAVQAEQAKNQPKRDTDLQKTQMKVQGALAKERMVQEGKKKDQTLNLFDKISSKGD